MKKKVWRKVWTFIMIISLMIPTVSMQVNAAVNQADYTQNDTYSYLVLADSGAVVEKNDAGEVVAGAVETNGNALDDKSLFTIEKATDPYVNRVQIISGVDGRVWKAEGTNLHSNGDKQGALHNGSWEGFELETVVGNDLATYIKTFEGKYIGSVDGKMTIVETVDAAAQFYIIDAKYDDISVWFEHVGTGKLIQANGAETPLTVNGEKQGDVVPNSAKFDVVYGEWDSKAVVNFHSLEYPNTRWMSGNQDVLKQIGGQGAGGWESVQVVPNGNGTISFKQVTSDKYYVVEGNNLKVADTNANGEFIYHSVIAPKEATNVVTSSIEDSEVTVSWIAPRNTIFTGYKVVATPEVGSGKATVTSEETIDTTVMLSGLEKGTVYDIEVRTMNGSAEAFGVSESVQIQTANGARPAQAVNLDAQLEGETIKVTFDEVAEAISYDIYKAESAYAEYTKVATVTTNEYVDNAIDIDTKYNNYYRVVSINENGSSDLSELYTSLETTMFGENTIILAETDGVDNINNVMADVFEKQNDFAADAQFAPNRYTIYFKPGDYTETNTMELGFYTQFAGLGETPYDVELNNVSIPAYLPEGELGNDTATNATCNFWRSMENVSVIDTGNEQGKADGSWRPDALNWAVAQAAPLRRIYSERPLHYDWNYGWASGGYVADSYITGMDSDGNGAGTHSGQQFYTRNSEIENNVFGTTLNNFFQGVEAPNLPTAANGEPLEGGIGYTNWGIAGNNGAQQVVTNIENTEKISEKPFLFLDDDGEYKVFVPELQENTVGTSWSENDMGAGEAISLDEFYIAKEGDDAHTINEQLEAGKHIFYTAGVYYAEEPIQINNADTIVLGSGYASIIPTNNQAAMITADVPGLNIAGLVFDAGEHSEYLLRVGTEKTDVDHSSNPTVLQDLFFRVGGTTDILTKADNALDINSNDVIGDHFWIWRADHGAGVEWYGNESDHGAIINGDNVILYGLFVEHFQKYNTLWNGENGKTYFYQNEATYDPISQEAWMSHNDTVNGYSSYKVSNTVETHYAVGLGIYNVFIYTGESYDSTEVQIQLDNPIEVPNKPGVIIENACTQTFANEDKVLQKFNYIINGVGNPVSSGRDAETGEVGTGWSRQFVLKYNNGTAIVGNPVTTDSDKNQFIGVKTIEDIQQPMNEAGDVNLDALTTVYEQATALDRAKYTDASLAKLDKALALAKTEIDKTVDWAVQADVDHAKAELETSMSELVEKEESDQSVPDEEKSEITNTEHNITVESLSDKKFPANTLFEITPITLSEGQNNSILQLVGENGEILSSFDMKLTRDNEPYEFGREMKVQFPITSEQLAKYKDFKVVFVAEDGSVEEMITELIDGKLYFTTDHFSTYALVATPITEVTTVPEASNTTTTQGSKTTPKTGDESNPILYILLFSGAIIGMGAVIVVKNKKQRSR